MIGSRKACGRWLSALFDPRLQWTVDTPDGSLWVMWVPDPFLDLYVVPVDVAE